MPHGLTGQKSREQIEERHKRAASRAVSLPHNSFPSSQVQSTSATPPLDQLLMAGIDGEEISDHISQKIEDRATLWLLAKRLR